MTEHGLFLKHLWTASALQGASDGIWFSEITTENNLLHCSDKFPTHHEQTQRGSSSKVQIVFWVVDLFKKKT
jgi:hypothetical protein